MGNLHGIFSDDTPGRLCLLGLDYSLSQTCTADNATCHTALRESDLFTHNTRSIVETCRYRGPSAFDTGTTRKYNRPALLLDLHHRSTYSGLGKLYTRK